MIRKFVHIGYPKNFSTSLQYDFFAKHPELFHLGVGPGLAYADPLVDATFEVYLKSCKGLKYHEVEPKLRHHFSSLIETAERSGKKALTVSSEHLCFAFSNDSIGFDQKMERLADLLGSDTHILLIIRNQADLIKSLYRESVRVGYPGDFASYAYLLYKYQDRNYCYDIRYDLVMEILERYFRRENIHLSIFEQMRDASGRLIMKEGRVGLIQELCGLMGISYMETEFGHYNEALPEATVVEMARLNKEFRHDLGNILYDTAEKHRMKHYLFDELQLPEPEEELYGDVRTKRMLVAKSGELAGDAKIDYRVRPDIAAALKAFYEKGNAALAEKYNLTLPAQYFDLRF